MDLADNMKSNFLWAKGPIYAGYFISVEPKATGIFY